MGEANRGGRHAESPIGLVIEVIEFAHCGNMDSTLNSTVMCCEREEDERPSEEVAEWLRVSKLLIIQHMICSYL